MYVVSLILIIIRALLYFLHRDLFVHFTVKNIGFLFFLIILIIFLKKVLNYKKYYTTVPHRIMAYRFKSNNDLRYSAIIVCLTIISAISAVIILRILRFFNPTDLDLIAQNLYNFYQKTNMLICLYNVIILCLCVKVLISAMQVSKKRLNIHVSKMHFYLLSYPRYVKLHNLIRDKFTIDHLVTNPLRMYSFELQSLIVFGYQKNITARYIKNITPLNKKDFWTEDDKIKYDLFTEKYQKKIELFHKAIRKLLYHLHLILFIFFFILDIKYNKGILIYTAHALPILFIYQLYTTICNFIHDKITYDICEDINMHYYNHIQIIDEKVMLVNGALYEISKEFPKDFLDYEACDFYYSIYTKKKNNSIY